MRRSRGYKEQTENQALKAENAALKRKISSLRKQMARMDVDRYQGLRDAVEAHEAEERRAGDEAASEKSWRCWDCPDGTLRITILERRDCAVYYRRCDSCGKRTKTKKYVPGKVKGGPDGSREEAVEGRRGGEGPEGEGG